MLWGQFFADLFSSLQFSQLIHRNLSDTVSVDYFVKIAIGNVIKDDGFT